MAMDGNTLGTAIKNALKSAGIIKVSKEVHEWTVTIAAPGSYTITVEDLGAEWSRDIEYEAEAGDSLSDVRDGLRAAAEADPVANALFDWATPASDKLTSTVKTAGAAYGYDSDGALADTALADEADVAAEADVEAFWQTVGGAIVAHIDTDAELNSTSTGTPGVID